MDGMAVMDGSEGDIYRRGWGYSIFFKCGVGTKGGLDLEMRGMETGNKKRPGNRLVMEVSESNIKTLTVKHV